jgi:hypothetical protein
MLDSLTAEETRLILAGAALVLSLVVLFSSRMIARAHYMHQMQNTWNAYNSAVISKQELLDASIALGNETSKLKPREHHYKISLAFLLLNPLQAAWIGMRHGLVSRSYAKANLEQILVPLLEDEDIYNLTQNRGYHPGFAKYCKNQRLKHYE